MFKKVAIIMCHFNKIEYGLKCIQSVFDSTYKDYDLVVVDNASTDGSPIEIKNKYGDNLTLIENKQNLGGSGGFNTGIRHVLEKGYEYICLLDNDALLKNDAIENLVGFLDKNKDCAIVGAKIYRLESENTLQEFGSFIDFEAFCVKVNYRDYIDSGDLPDVTYCDYVPACCSLVRVNVVKELGMMPEQNFIYWDDMELGYRCILAGYKVAAYGKAVVWHKMAALTRENTFHDYYFMRNAILFFAKYCDEEKIKVLCDMFMLKIFQSIYAGQMKSIENLGLSRIYAFYDAINEATGQAIEVAILPIETPLDLIKECLGGIQKIQVKYNGHNKALEIFLNKIIKDFQEMEVKIVLSDHYDLSLLAKRYPKEELLGDNIKLQQIFPNEIFINQLEEGTKIVEMCSHVFDTNDIDPSIIYIDRFLNVIANDHQRDYCKNFDFAKQFFYKTNYNYAYQKLLNINKKYEDKRKKKSLDMNT